MTYSKEDIDKLMNAAENTIYTAEAQKLYLAAIAMMRYNEQYGKLEVLHGKEKAVVKGETKKAGPGPKERGRAADTKTPQKIPGGKGSPAGKATGRK